MDDKDGYDSDGDGMDLDDDDDPYAGQFGPAYAIHNLGVLELDSVIVSAITLYSAIYSQGDLVVRSSMIIGNPEADSPIGWGINDMSTSSISDSVITGFYGGIYTSGEVDIEGSLLEYNGMGISVNFGEVEVVSTAIQYSLLDGLELKYATASVDSSSLNNNRYGITTYGSVSLQVQTSTLSSNVYAYLDQSVTRAYSRTFLCESCTIAYNTAGGIDNAKNRSLVTLSNSIVQKNGPSCAMDLTGSYLSLGYNLFASGGSCPWAGPQDVRGDADLLPLADNGANMMTHLLGSSSAAVDKGGSCAALDQIARTRPADGNGDGVSQCDVGAVERTPNLEFSYVQIGP